MALNLLECLQIVRISSAGRVRRCRGFRPFGPSTSDASPKPFSGLASAPTVKRLLGGCGAAVTDSDGDQPRFSTTVRRGYTAGIQWVFLKTLPMLLVVRGWRS